jgi:hypothetical protein
MKEDLKNVKREVKELELHFQGKEKELKTLHEEYISKEEKIKEINYLLKDKKNHPPKPEVTQKMIEEVQEKLVKIRAEREEVEAKGFKEIEDAT